MCNFMDLADESLQKQHSMIFLLSIFWAYETKLLPEKVLCVSAFLEMRTAARTLQLPWMPLSASTWTYPEYF